jgi:hypothetical protein
MKAKKTTIIKSGKEFTLINPEKDIPIEFLIKLFGNEVIKVNFSNFGLIEIEAINGYENLFKTVENISELEWENITI